LVLTGALAASIALRSWPNVAALLESAGVIISLFLWPDQMRYYLAPGAVCIAGLLVSRRVGVLTALVLSFLPGMPGAAIASLWLTSLALYLGSDFFYALVHESLEREEAAARLERELLARREELRRLNDSLRNAYTLLERTNHELAEARDEAEEARRSKTQFAATISHELRTPLNLILGFAEAIYKMPELYRGAVLTPELRGDIRQIYLSARHLLELVDDVLDLSRVEQVRLSLLPEETDLAALIHEAVATVSGLFRGRPVRLEVCLPDHLPTCVLDRTRIRQVLINLLANAARFTERGQVRVSASHDQAHGEVVVCVSDTGPGLPPEEHARIFDAFYQVANPLRRKHGGSGLGLAVCKTFVELHGGRIWVESKPGEGSRFSFSLPVHARIPVRSEWKLPGAPDPFGESVLVIGASQQLASTIQRCMPDLQVRTVMKTSEIDEAIALWHPRAVAIFQYGEGRRGDGLTGLSAWPGLPVLTCELPEQSFRAYPNVRGILTKPLTLQALNDALESLGRVKELLVVDDDEGMTRLVQRMLSHAQPSIKVLAAHDGEHALSLIRRNAPDAVLLDLAMPGVDGLAVLETMVAEGFGTVPALLLTALDLHGQEGIVARSVTIRSAPGLREVELCGVLEAVARLARPSYIGAEQTQVLS
jgi:signal transduction histidine kinase